MFGLTTPIGYNTDLYPILSHYYMGFCGGNCSPFASLFNPPWVYSGGIGIGNPFWGGYQCDNFYPSIFALNYAPQTQIFDGFGYPFMSFGGGGVFQYSGPDKASTHQQNSQISAGHASTSNPIKNTQASKTKTDLAEQQKTNIGIEFVNTARKYSACNEFDDSQKKFCVNSTCKMEDPLDQEWCTDFVTYVVKETYRKQGKPIPAGFGNHDVQTLKNWAISNNCFIRTSNQPKKASFISENIKPGDIMIINENGASHTGFVTKIDKNTGVIHTIEGNRDDRVKEYSYSSNYADLSGFIRLTS